MRPKTNATNAKLKSAYTRTKQARRQQCGPPRLTMSTFSGAACELNWWFVCCCAIQIVLAIAQHFSRCQHNISRNQMRNERCCVSFGSEIVSQLNELQIAIQHFVVRAAMPNIIHRSNSAGKNHIKIHYVAFELPLRTEQLANFSKYTHYGTGRYTRAKHSQRESHRVRHIINYNLLKTLQLR